MRDHRRRVSRALARIGCKLERRRDDEKALVILKEIEKNTMDYQTALWLLERRANT